MHAKVLCITEERSGYLDALLQCKFKVELPDNLAAAIVLLNTFFPNAVLVDSRNKQVEFFFRKFSAKHKDVPVVFMNDDSNSEFVRDPDNVAALIKNTLYRQIRLNQEILNIEGLPDLKINDWWLLDDRISEKAVLELPRDNATFKIETGYFLLSKKNNSNVFISGGKFGDGIEVAKKHSVCVSVQTGCKQGCVFCATGQLKNRVENLSPLEMVSQVVQFLKYSKNSEGLWLARQSNQPLSVEIPQVSFMGMGEPLANLDNVLEAIWILNDIFDGKITFTVSTRGDGAALRKLLRQDLSNLSIRFQLSLIWPKQSIREKFMPTTVGANKLKYTLPLMLELSEKVNKKLIINIIPFEKPRVMRNNTKAAADEFLRLLKPNLKRIRIKLSTFNEHCMIPAAFKGGSQEILVERFRRAGTTVQVFRNLGIDRRRQERSAACGTFAGTQY